MRRMATAVPSVPPIWARICGSLRDSQRFTPHDAAAGSVRATISPATRILLRKLYRVERGSIQRDLQAVDELAKDDVAPERRAPGLHLFVLKKHEKALGRKPLFQRVFGALTQ